MTNIAIIGAGISGLTLAHSLGAKHSITVFDKARGVGGRLATRRSDNYAFDHGTQFISARTQAFKDFIKPLLEAKVIAPWLARFVELTANGVGFSGTWEHSKPHYVGVPAMNAIAKHLSQNLNIKLNCRVERLEQIPTGWRLFNDQNQTLGDFDWVVVTTPVAQAREILPSYFSHYSDLSNINMSACYCLMLGFSETLELGFDCSLVRNSDISWIAVNSSKPERAKSSSIVVHSANKWADANIDKDHGEVQEHLLATASQIANYPLQQAEHKVLHLWRYANIGKQIGPKYYLDQEHKLLACGDWCIRGRVEAAFESARAAAIAINGII